VASQLSTFDFWMGSINFLLKGALNSRLILPFEFLKGKLGDYPIIFLRVFDGENQIVVRFSNLKFLKSLRARIERLPNSSASSPKGENWAATQCLHF
jgi:hypothetical protein